MNRMWLYDLPKDAVFLNGDADPYRVVIPSAERKHPKSVRAVKVDDPEQIEWFGFMGNYEVEVIS